VHLLICPTVGEKGEISGTLVDGKICREGAYTKAAAPTGWAPDVLPHPGQARRVYVPPWLAD
jgi:hypothetical protein